MVQLQLQGKILTTTFKVANKFGVQEHLAEAIDAGRTKAILTIREPESYIDKLKVAACPYDESQGHYNEVFVKEPNHYIIKPFYANYFVEVKFPYMHELRR